LPRRRGTDADGRPGPACQGSWEGPVVVALQPVPAVIAASRPWGGRGRARTV